MATYLLSHKPSKKDNQDMLGTGGENMNELLNDILFWTPTYGLTTVGQEAKTYIHQFCAETGCHLVYLPIGMDCLRESKKSVLSAYHGDDEIGYIV